MRQLARVLHSCIVTLFIGALLMASTAGAQKSTERYIPIGESPGISGVYSIIGEIAQFDAESRTLVVENAEGAHTATVTDETRIWLDRTEWDLPNLIGGPDDLRRDRRVEVKYLDDETRETADWIKVATPPE